MKILIFGGGQNFIEFYDFCVDFWQEVKICGILDNDQKKWGSVKYGIEIVPPGCIDQYEYDVILICSIHENEIKQQLIDEFHVDKKIETRRHFFDEVIFPWYEKKYHNKKILIVGERFRFDIFREVYYEFFNVIGFVALDEIALIDNYDYDYVLLTRYNRKKEFEAVAQVLQGGFVDKKRLLTNAVFSIYRSQIKSLSYGECFPDKIFLLICIVGGGGLGSICNNVISNVLYARENGYVPVIDMKTYRTQYLEADEYGTVNVWEKFFLQPEGYALEDVKEAKFVMRVFGEIRWQSDYKDNVQPWLPDMRYSLSEKLRNYLKKFEHKRALGVLFRGTDYSCNKPDGHYVQPDLNSMVNMTRQKMKEWGNFDLIFLCTEVQQACERFEEEFGGKVLYYPQLRFDEKFDAAILAIHSFGISGERTKRGADYWIALNILASCNSIVAGRCSGTEMALKINDNRYENVYLFDLGRYGIED